MKNMRIVDCDVHVHELPEELAEHCEMPWRKAVEAIAPGSAASSRFGSVGDYVVPGLAQGSGEGSDPLWPGGQNCPDFIDSVKNDRTPAVDGQSARDAREMIMAAYESAATGRAVRIPMDTASPVYREGVVGIKQLESEIPSDSILRKKRLYGLGPV